MHVHLPQDSIAAEAALWQLLAEGVTTARQMFGKPMYLRLRDRLARGELLGPRLYTAGPVSAIP